MDRIHVREVLGRRDADLAQLSIQHTVVFDDSSELVVYRNETRYSALFWGLFHSYQNSPILPQHHANTVLGDSLLNAKTHNKLSGEILKTIVHHEQLHLPEQKEPLLAAIYKTIEYAQNTLAVITEEDVIGLDILDFIQISRHPLVQALRMEAMADVSKIKYANENVIKLIKNHSDFMENNLAKAVKAGMVKENQVVQCVLFIGFPSEVDGTIFKEPIWTNYTVGLTRFYDLVADSRKAAKSHMYSDSSLKDAEYMARKFQLFDMVLERVVFEDCGTDKLMPWLVSGKRFDSNGTVLYGGDLPLMIGKHYKLTKDGEYFAINGKEDHLVGKTIWLRSMVSGCQHHDPHCVCHRCVGDISQNLSRFDNVGHIGSVTFTRDLTQTILSFKHVITSSVMVAIVLDDFERGYLNTGEKSDGIYLNRPKKGEKLFVTVARDDVPGLVDLASVEDTAQMSLMRVSSINTIALTTVNEKGYSEEVILKTKVKQASAMLSRDMLTYLGKKGWEVDSNNNFCFDMSDWDYSKRMLVTQNKEESVVDLVKQVEQMVQSNQQLHKKRAGVDNAPQILLQELFDLVNSKFSINLFCFEVVVYGLMTFAPDSYAMPRGSDNPVLGISDSLTIHRTLGQAMAYERHTEALFSPSYFYPGYRPDSLFDVFLKPKEVVQTYYGDQA